MGRQRLTPIPSDLAAVCKRFEKWRATRVGRSRIPASLWDLAVSLAKSHSVYRVSKTLRVSYRGLKRRVAAASARPSQEKCFSAFVELDLSRSFPPEECIIDLADRDGSKMTIRLKGSSSVDVTALSSAFFGRGR